MNENIQIEYLSYSQINMYKRCPYQYKLRYIDGLKIPPKSSRILGTGVHTGLEVGFKEKKLSGGSDKKIKNLMKDKTVETIELTIKEEQQIDWEEGDNIDKLKDDGSKMIEVYYDEKGKKIKPDEVEKEFEILLNSQLKLKGKIDLITKKLIIDYKTGQQKPADEWILWDDQLKIYRIVYPLKIQSHWIIRYKTKDPAVFIYEREITEEEAKQTLQDILVVAKLISTGYFYKRNDVRTCGWCGYKEVCTKQ